MKEKYLDLMEMALEAYTEERIRDFLAEVKTNGLKEHGFPRLAVNIGILIVHGRRRELLPLFVEMMDICCEQIPVKQAANDFSVKEICFLFLLLEKVEIVEKAQLQKWKDQLRTFQPWKGYKVIAKSPDTPCANWAAFGAASEYLRMIVCGVDSSDFVDWQLSSQMLSFDENGMYKDPNNPIVYDYVTRLQMAVMLHFGYDGRFKEQIIAHFNKASDLVADMQSVTGEMAFGGRSIQFLHNEADVAAMWEFEAARYARMGDMERARSFKASADMAAQAAKRWLSERPIRHIKNKYDIDSGIGCEPYGYFNKYMITLASFMYLAYLFADDTIEPTVAAAERGGFVVRTSEDFHKTVMNAGGYFLEFDTNADVHYDANGLGRVHRKGCASQVCLSVPFPSQPQYGLEKGNPGAMSLCCYARKGDVRLNGAESTAKYKLTDSAASPDRASATMECALAEDVTVTQSYTVSKDGVDITLSGPGEIGFMLPVFDFDGSDQTEVTVGENSVAVAYRGSRCVYTFDGRLSGDFTYYYNRNGRYRVYELAGRRLHVTLEGEGL